MLVWVAFVLLSIAGAAPAFAQPASPGSQPTALDDIWKQFTDWYSDEANPTIQQVQFTGRFQHDFATVDADQGTKRESNVRRIRLGSRVAMYRRFLVHVEVDLNPQEHDPLYVRLTDAYVQWSGPRLKITGGKQSVPFTLEGATSSKEQIAIDRSNLANNLWFGQEYIPGLTVSGRAAPWNYFAGVYSAGEANRELGRFTGSVFTLTTLGYDFARTLGVRSALVSGNYVYQRADADNTFTRPFDHIASLNLRLETLRWGLRADLTGGTGYLGQSDVWGAMVMPFINVTKNSQVVTRYTVLNSDDVNGIQLAAYENRVVRGRGDRYDDLYVGANYYIYGHKLKLQSGLQFARMKDRAGDGGAYSGVSWTSGVRVGW